MLTFREYRPGDEAQIVALLQTVFGEVRSIEWWRWYYLEAPAGTAVVRLAFQGGRVVGFRALVPYHVWSGSERVVACQATDAATHPDYRGQGVFRTLTTAVIAEAKARGWSFIFSFPNARSYPLNVRQGWRGIGRPRMWFKVLPVLSTAGPTEAEEVGEAVPVRWAPGWVHAADGVARVYRDAEYLNWRYLRRPDRTYRVLVPGSGPDPNAYAVLRVYRTGVPRAYLLDFSPGGLFPVHWLTSVTRHVARDGVRLMAAWEGTVAGRSLLRLGFWPHPWRAGVLAVRELLHAPPDTMRVTLGDTDYA
jgi:GNAT superfamily N-acetyltransferase